MLRSHPSGRLRGRQKSGKVYEVYEKCNEFLEECRSILTISYSVLLVQEVKLNGDVVKYYEEIATTRPIEVNSVHMK